jgi:hypothetical protein
MKYKVDKLSFELGMINCFAEMVSCGVKKLAISPPLFPEDYDVIGPLSDDIVRGFGIRSFLEKSLLTTDLQTEDFTRGKWSILYYEKESVLEDYLALKKKKLSLEERGKYDVTARKAISREFMRLLSYPDNKIEEKLSKTDPSDPFILTEKQGGKR